MKIHVHEKTCLGMFIAYLFIIAKNKKQTNKSTCKQLLIYKLTPVHRRQGETKERGR